jgi:hypothetical protein
MGLIPGALALLAVRKPVLARVQEMPHDITELSPESRVKGQGWKGQRQRSGC